MLRTPLIVSAKQGQIRTFTQDVILFLNNIIFQYKNPLPFETEAHSLHTIFLLREHSNI